MTAVLYASRPPRRLRRHRALSSIREAVIVVALCAAVGCVLGDLMMRVLLNESLLLSLGLTAR